MFLTSAMQTHLLVGTVASLFRAQILLVDGTL